MLVKKSDRAAHSLKVNIIILHCSVEHYNTSVSSSCSKQVAGHRAYYDLTEEFSHHLLIGRPKNFLRLFDCKETLLESEVYSFAEDISPTAFDNYVYSVTLV
jgi:hypothetical protein